MRPMVEREHTSSHYERRLRLLKDKLLLMGYQAEQMIAAGLAENVIQSDRIIDDMSEEIFRELLAYMFEDPRTVSRALKLIFIAKHLERVGDHSTNIAEMVIFMVRGRDIRHGARGLWLTHYRRRGPVARRLPL